MRWGLDPRFHPTQSLSTINARIEGITTSKLYAPLINSHRCVVIVDAFYEWDQTAKTHKPYLVRFRDEVPETFIPTDAPATSFADDSISSDADSILPEGVAPLLLAAIYDTNPSTGNTSCSVLTTGSSGPLAKVHTRMPVLLSPETARTWLHSAVTFDDLAGPVIKTCSDLADSLMCTQVSTLVNSISNKSREVTLPLSEQKKRSFEKGLGRYFSKASAEKKVKIIHD